MRCARTHIPNGGFSGQPELLEQVNGRSGQRPDVGNILFPLIDEVALCENLEGVTSRPFVRERGDALLQLREAG